MKKNIDYYKLVDEKEKCKILGLIKS